MPSLEGLFIQTETVAKGEGLSFFFFLGLFWFDLIRRFDI